MISGDPLPRGSSDERTTARTEAASTIWRVPDDLWEKIEPILAEHDPSKGTGRPRVDRRAVLDAIIFRLRTGCQWNRLPKDFPNDRSVPRTFQRWLARGVLERVWAQVAEAAGIIWEQPVVAATLGKARLGRIWLDPTRLTAANGV